MNYVVRISHSNVPTAIAGQKVKSVVGFLQNGLSRAEVSYMT